MRYGAVCLKITYYTKIFRIKYSILEIFVIYGIYAHIKAQLCLQLIYGVSCTISFLCMLSVATGGKKNHFLVKTFMYRHDGTTV